MIQNAINLLGLTATDKVTGLTGVITSVTFDLFGCVQVIVYPTVKEGGTIEEGKWFDVNRLTIQDDARKMPVPNFSQVQLAENWEKGPETKPKMPTRSMPRGQ